MLTKICSNPECIHNKIQQSVENFHKCKSNKDGYGIYCKDCKKEKDKQYRLENRDRLNAYLKEYRENPCNQERIKDSKKIWLDNNRDHHNAKNREWEKNNKGYARHKCAKRRANRKSATPSWANLEEIRAIYQEAKELEQQDGIPRVVHHIIPLKGRNNNRKHIVSGLHIASNLQIMIQEEHEKLDHVFKLKTKNKI